MVNGWQWFLLIIIIVVAFLLFILVCFNWNSKESVEILKPILGGLFVALFFSITALATPLPTYQLKTHVGIFTKGDETVMPFPALDSDKSFFVHGYDKINSILFSKHGHLVKPTKDHRYLIELFELTFFYGWQIIFLATGKLIENGFLV